jgi:poly-gamma-glutamate synthesis protein (capsule biosynthesis protein)
LGIETYKQRPIVYSLGNFVFDQDFSLETRKGLAMGVTVYNDRLVLEPIPIYTELSQPRLVEGEEKKRRLQELARFSDVALRDQIESGAMTFLFP